MTVRWRAVFVTVAALALSVTSVYAVLAVLPARPSVELSAISGELKRCQLGFCVDEGPVFFGPDWYLEQTPSEYDYNGDGEIGTLFEELAGILGERAVVEVDPSTDHPNAYVVNGAPWLDFEGSPPWSTDSVAPTTAASTAGDEPVPESDATEPEPQPEPEPVPLTALTGLLEPCGNGFCLDQTRLYFGPWWFLNHTVASHDYDADGAVSSPLGELEGLLGAEVQVEAVDDDEGQSVINLNGLPWRSLDEQPPWAGGPDGEVLAPLGDDADGDHSGSSDGPPEDLPAPAQP